MAPKKRGTGGNEAELLFEKWLRSEGWTFHRAARAGFIKLPNGRSFCQSHDLFGCLDFIAFIQNETLAGGGPWGVQVTTQSGRTARRRKVEEVAWPPSWRLSIVSHETTPNPANRARTLHFWRVEDFVCGNWQEPVVIAFDKSAVEQASREAKAQAQAPGKVKGGEAA